MAISEKYQEPIGIAVVAASAVGPVGILLPAFDMAGIGVIWTTMVEEIARRSGHRVNPAGILKVVTAAAGAASGYALGSKILTWSLVALVPFAGVPTAMAANATLNGIFTLKLGLSCAKQFDRPDFDTLDILNLAATVAGALTPVPSAEEVALLKKLLTG